MGICYFWFVLCFLLCVPIELTWSGIGNILDVRYWNCLLKKRYTCPDNDIKFYLYLPEEYSSYKTIRKRIDVRNPLALKYSGWDPHGKNVMLIHGFNGTESKSPMTVLRNAYLARGGYNVFTIDWHALTHFPCYLSSLSNTRLVAQCTAQLYAYIMDMGGRADQTTCIGHSLGAHICGMMSNHLTRKQHRIVGLDPARPLVSMFGSRQFRLTTEDAYQVQVIHTNAGFLGEVNRVGHVDFCVNGGRFQPGCKGHRLKRARCSHFQSVCYFAASVRGLRMNGTECSAECPKAGNFVGISSGRTVPMGHDTPFTAAGTYCVRYDHNKDCPFN